MAKTNSPFFCPWQISLLYDNTLSFSDASLELSVQSQDLYQHCPTKKIKLASAMESTSHPWCETLSVSRPGTHGSLELVVYGLYISLNFYLCFVFIILIWLISCTWAVQRSPILRIQFSPLFPLKPALTVPVYSLHSCITYLILMFK